MARDGHSRGGGSRSGTLPRPVQVSKKLSWLLRHGAEKENLTLGPGGYANVADVLSNRNLRSLKVTFDEIREIVAENDKQRFKLFPASELEKDSNVESEGEAGERAQAIPLPSDNPKDWLIRATQGHSVKIEDSEGLLTPISVAANNIPSVAVHGTTHAAWPLILASGGLKTMGRNHVHFASGLPAGFTSADASATDDASAAAAAPLPVISGMRKTSTILVVLDLPKAMEAGLQFGVSENGVILTEGDADGVVALEFFKRVEDRTGWGVLVEEGKVVKEAPATWGGKGKGKGKG